MIESGEPSGSSLDSNETADGVYARIAADLEAAGIRADVATILRETIFSDDEALAAAPAVMERLLSIPVTAS